MPSVLASRFLLCSNDKTNVTASITLNTSRSCLPHELTLLVLGVGGVVELGVLDITLCGVCDSDSVLLPLQLPLHTVK